MCLVYCFYARSVFSLVFLSVLIPIALFIFFVFFFVCLSDLVHAVVGLISFLSEHSVVVAMMDGALWFWVGGGGRRCHCHCRRVNKQKRGREEGEERKSHHGRGVRTG